MRLEEFFAFSNERHKIYKKRLAGETGPWTDDEILRTFKFTNIFRELDRVTIWFRENVREPLRDDKRVLFATIAFRWFNRIETAERIKDLFWDWEGQEVYDRVFPHPPYVTAAYMIATPRGLDKLQGVLDNIQNCRDVIDDLYKGMNGKTLEEAHACLVKVPQMGPFYSYEVVTDLRYTHMLENAPDIMTWANPGPGAYRGANRVLGRDCNHKIGKKEAIQVMRDILGESSLYWDYPDEPWEMREVEHTLCEFDKYERARSGEGRPKQLFKPQEKLLDASY